MRYKKRYFCEDNNRASGFMMDLAIGCYNEHPTMVEELICKRWFFGLRTLSLELLDQKSIVIFKYIWAVPLGIISKLLPTKLNSKWIFQLIWFQAHGYVYLVLFVYIMKMYKWGLVILGMVSYVLHKILKCRYKEERSSKCTSCLNHLSTGTNSYNFRTINTGNIATFRCLCKEF